MSVRSGFGSWCRVSPLTTYTHDEDLFLHEVLRATLLGAGQEPSVAGTAGLLLIESLLDDGCRGLLEHLHGNHFPGL